MTRRPESLTFIVTFKEVSGKMFVTLSGNEARNGVEDDYQARESCEMVRDFINAYFGSEVVKDVEIEEGD